MKAVGWRKGLLTSTELLYFQILPGELFYITAQHDNLPLQYTILSVSQYFIMSKYSNKSALSQNLFFSRLSSSDYWVKYRQGTFLDTLFFVNKPR